VLLLTTGQSGDSPALAVLLDHLHIPRSGTGRPRTTPDALRGDKAYSAKAHRDNLRARGVKVVIPEMADQQANGKNKGSSDRVVVSMQDGPTVSEIGGPPMAPSPEVARRLLARSCGFGHETGTTRDEPA